MEKASEELPAGWKTMGVEETHEELPAGWRAR